MDIKNKYNIKLKDEKKSPVVQKWPLVDHFNIYLLAPWKINSDILNNYFGEKISLYFKFTLVYLKSMIPLVLFGIMLYTLDFTIYYYPGH